MADQLLTGTTLVESSSRSDGDVLIGGIVAWCKSFVGAGNLQDGWVECNGQVLVDSQSSMNGETIPDLNGYQTGGTQRFLRGGGNGDETATTSGDTGGSSSLELDNSSLTGNIANNTTSANISYAVGDSGSFDDSLKISNGSGSTYFEGKKSKISNSLPHYYEIVWVMRTR